MSARLASVPLACRQNRRSRSGAVVRAIVAGSCSAMDGRRGENPRSCPDIVLSIVVRWRVAHPNRIAAEQVGVAGCACNVLSPRISRISSGMVRNPTSTPAELNLGALKVVAREGDCASRTTASTRPNRGARYWSESSQEPLLTPRGKLIPELVSAAASCGHA